MDHNERLPLCVTAIFVLLLFILVVKGQSQIGLLEKSILNEELGGSRAMAMGGAFTALANDGTAILWNPAALSRSSHLSLSSHGVISFDNVAVTLPTTLSSQKYRVDSHGTFDLQFAGITIPLLKKNLKWTLGAALQNMVPLQQRKITSLINPSAGWSDKINTNRSGSIYAMNIGMGLAINPKFSFGMTVASLFGKQQTDSTIIFTTGSFETIHRSRLKNDFSGTLMRLGVLWQIHRQFSIGSCVNLPQKIELSQRRYGDPFAESLADSANLTLSKPLNFAVGLCWILSKNFLFSFDYRYRPWNQAMVKRDHVTFDNLFVDAHSFHMGSEFSYEASYYTFLWRFGFFTQPEQITDSRSGKHPQISSHFFTTGIGIQTKHFAFDLSLIHQNMQYKAPSLVEDAEWAEITENNYRVHFGMSIFIE